MADTDKNKAFILGTIADSPTLTKFLEDKQDFIKTLGLNDNNLLVLKGLFCILYKRGVNEGVGEAKNYYQREIVEMQDKLKHVEAELSYYTRQAALEDGPVEDDAGFLDEEAPTPTTNG